MARAPSKNLHVPLPDELHRRLRALSNDQGRPATEIAREAIDRWVSEERRRIVHDELQEYANRVAGTKDDLDEALEETGVESLRALSDE